MPEQDLYVMPTEQPGAIASAYGLPEGAHYYGVAINGDVDWFIFDHTPLVIEMPCGCVFYLETAYNIPGADVPCPCGNPLHHVVKYFEAAHE